MNSKRHCLELVSPEWDFQSVLHSHCVHVLFIKFSSKILSHNVKCKCNRLFDLSYRIWKNFFVRNFPFHLPSAFRKAFWLHPGLTTKRRKVHVQLERNTLTSSLRFKLSGLLKSWIVVAWRSSSTGREQLQLRLLAQAQRRIHQKLILNTVQNALQYHSDDLCNTLSPDLISSQDWENWKEAWAINPFQNRAVQQNQSSNTINGRSFVLFQLFLSFVLLPLLKSQVRKWFRVSRSLILEKRKNKHLANLLLGRFSRDGDLIFGFCGSCSLLLG